MKSNTQNAEPSLPANRSGFTIVELLVVIAIIMVLGALIFGLAKGAMEKAHAVNALSRIRQCGVFLFSSSADNNGTLSVFTGGNGHKEQRLISIAATAMDLGVNDNSAVYQATHNMVYTPSRDPGKYDSWGTWGVNLDNNEEFGMRWKKEWAADESGTRGWIRQINPGMVDRPSNYPVLGDSSNDKGKPRLRFGNENSYRFAMRYGGKGPAIFLDGSSRMIGPVDLDRYGIESAYLFEDGQNGAPSLVRAKKTGS